jgi:hypothetical protein
VAKRWTLAMGAITGDLDGVHDVIEKLKESEALNERLRIVISRIHDERQYWYALWFSQGKEFENSLNMMIHEINNLRKKAGVDGEKWEEIARQAFHDRHVGPKKHPVPGITTELKDISSPPIRPEEAPKQEPKS